MNKEIKEILEVLKHYDFSKDVPEEIEEKINKLLDYITILEKGIEYVKRIEKDYKTKFDKILEQMKIVEDADLSEYNFCKFIDKIKSIIQGSDKE